MKAITNKRKNEKQNWRKKKINHYPDFCKSIIESKELNYQLSIKKNMRNLFLLAIIVFVCSSCEKYYTFTGYINNTSRNTVRIFYYNDDRPRKKVDSTVIKPGEEGIVRTQTFLGTNDIGSSCNEMVFRPIGDSVVIKADTNRIVTKNIRSDNNWTRKTDKEKVDCRLTISQADIQ